MPQQNRLPGKKKTEQIVERWGRGGLGAESPFRDPCDPDSSELGHQSRPSLDWRVALQAAAISFAEAAAEKREVLARIAGLEGKIQDLCAQIGHLREEQPKTIPIQSLAPWNLEVLKEIKVVISKTGDEYTATFYDANISMTGDTPEEAVENLKALIADEFEADEEEEEKLGPGLVRQLQTLRDFIRKRPADGENHHERTGS